MKTFKIKEICHLEKGKQIDTTLLSDGNPYKYINGGIKESGYYTTYNTEGEAVLVSEGGASCGYVNYINEKFWCGCHCYKLTKCKFLPKYIYYALKGNQEKLMALRTGAAMPNIKKTTFQDMELLLNENHTEQELVIKELDKIQIALEIKKTELIALDDLVKSRFIEMFGDVDTSNSPYNVCKLNDVANVGSSHRVFTTEFVEKGIPFYRGTEIGELANGKIPANPYYISLEHYQRLASDSTKPKIGDLLMPSICSKGQVWMVDTDEPFYYKDGRVLCISPNLSVFNPLYLLHFMRFKTEIEYQKLDTGPTFSEFKIFILKNFDVIVPPLSIQNEFAEYVKLTDKSKYVCQSTPSIFCVKALHFRHPP